MKDLSYLQAFSYSVLSGVRMVMEKGFTIKDINDFLGRPRMAAIPKQVGSEESRGEETTKSSATKLEKPCCGGEIDKQVEAFREKQRELKVEKAKKSIIDSS